jgi:hypothetical protein
MKIRPVGVELFHADRQADMTKLGVAFSKSVNAPKKSSCQNTWLNRYTLVNSLESKSLPLDWDETIK